MPTYYAQMMAEVLAEMPAADGEPHPAVEAAATRAAVLVARETHWSEVEALRCLAEARECNEAARQAIGQDAALAMARGRISADLVRGLDLINGRRS